MVSEHPTRLAIFDFDGTVADTWRDIATALNPGCRTANSPSGCLLGKWLPKCSDGTDDGCSEPEAVCQDGTRPRA